MEGLLTTNINILSSTALVIYIGKTGRKLGIRYKNTEWKWILRPNELFLEVSAQPAFQNTSPLLLITLLKRTM